MLRGIQCETSKQIDGWYCLESHEGPLCVHNTDTQNLFTVVNILKCCLESLQRFNVYANKRTIIKGELIIQNTRANMQINWLWPLVDYKVQWHLPVKISVSISTNYPFSLAIKNICLLPVTVFEQTWRNNYLHNIVAELCERRGARFITMKYNDRDNMWNSNTSIVCWTLLPRLPK